MLNRISATELDNWSRNNPRQAQEILPELVIRLVLATSDKIIRHNFSIEKGIQYAGYDGVLESEEKSNFFPKGKSVWECGTDENLIQKFDDDIKDDLYYLCENGTKIVYQGKTLYKKALKKDDVKEVLDILKQDQECMLVVSGDKHAYISKSFEDKKDFISLFMKNVQFVESYDDIEDDILKFSIASFDDQMEQRIEKIQKQLKPHLKLVTTGNVWFDIFYKDVNKGTTLTHLLEILKIKPEESGAFGDQMNDYEMLQTVKYGYAMANAMPPVKEVAYQVIDSNENDGVILKIKEILKGNY